MKKTLIVVMFIITLFTSICYADAIAPEIEYNNMTILRNNDAGNNYLIYVVIAVVIIIISCVITLLINKNNKKGE